MATKKTTTAKIAEFNEPEEEVVVVEEEPTVVEKVVAPGAPETKKGRVKGSWTMYWGTNVYEFVDGNTYTLPIDLCNHLKVHGNIYDTL